MSFFIKKIKDGNFDETVHSQFQKFSRGNFADRALIVAKKKKDKYALRTTHEYTNELVRFLAEKLGDQKTNVTGVIVSTLDLTGQVEFEDKKQFQGVKRYIINSELSGKEIIEICDKVTGAFVGFSFKTEDTELKVKPKAPKSGKPSSKGDKKPAPDFCKIKTKDKELVKLLLFDIDIDNFTEAEVEHVFAIGDLEVDYNIKDPKEMREKAKRKGKIIRKTTVDGKETTTELEFVA